MLMDDPEGEASLEAQAAWLAGRKAGFNRIGPDANPHPPSNDLATDWEDGWREGTRIRNVLTAERSAKAWARLRQP